MGLGLTDTLIGLDEEMIQVSWWMVEKQSWYVSALTALSKDQTVMIYASIKYNFVIKEDHKVITAECYRNTSISIGMILSAWLQC